MSSSVSKSKSFKNKALVSRLVGRTIYQKILRVYFLTAFIGAVMLALPFSRKNNVDFNFFDAFFTAISAFTNTGLATHTTSETFSFFGQFMILLLIQAGGLGFLTIIIFLWSLLRRGGILSVEQRWFLHAERGSYKRMETLPAVKAGIIVILVSEILGALILSFFFYYATPLTPSVTSITQAASTTTPTSQGVENFQGDLGASIWAGVFHSVSAANNAGFDILGRYSIIPYRTDENNLLSAVLLIESIIGGIGYPVFYDVYLWFTNKKATYRAHTFSLFSKIAILAYSLIAIISIVLVLIFEAGLAWKYPTSILFNHNENVIKSATENVSFGWGRNAVLNKLWNIIYLTFSSRSSGFSSIDTSQLTEVTKWLLSILMFIGASPASTGGGIRTITIFVIFARMFYTATGRRHLSIYKKTIDEQIVFESCNVFVMSTMLVCFSVFFIIISIPAASEIKLGDVVFEATSAFGTAGLTSGITSKCNVLGKVMLVALMFVGQLGVSNALLSFTDLQSTSKNRKYCSENLRII